MQWIKELADIGFAPEIKILEECDKKEHLADKERFWIYKILKEKGMLLNVSFVSSAMLYANYVGRNDVKPEVINDAETVDVSDISGIEEVGSFIRHNRRLSKLTQPEFAKKAGVGVRLIRELESGVDKGFRTTEIFKILKMFGATLSVKRFKKAT